MTQTHVLCTGCNVILVTLDDSWEALDVMVGVHLEQRHPDAVDETSGIEFVNLDQPMYAMESLLA